MPARSPYQTLEAPAAPTGQISDYDLLQAEFDRKKRLADLLQQQALSPKVLDTVKSQSWMNALVPMAQAAASEYTRSGLSEEERATTERRNREMSADLLKMTEGVPAKPAYEGVGPPTPEGEAAPGYEAQPARQFTPAEWLQKSTEFGSKYGKFAQDIAKNLASHATSLMLPKAPTYQHMTTYTPEGKQQPALVDVNNPGAKPIPVGSPGPGSALQQRVDQYRGVLKRDNPDISDADLESQAVRLAARDFQVLPEGGGLVSTSAVAGGGAKPPAAAPAPQPTLPQPPQLGTPAPAAPVKPPIVPDVTKFTTPEGQATAKRIQQEAPAREVNRVEVLQGERANELAIVNNPSSTPDQKRIAQNNVDALDKELKKLKVPVEAPAAPVAAAPAKPIEKPLAQMSEEEVYKKYSKDSSNAPYIVPPPPPGMVMRMPQTKPAANLAQDVQKLSKQMDDKYLPDLKTGMKQFDDTIDGLIAKYPDIGIKRDKSGEWTGLAPGMGWQQLDPFPDVKQQFLQQAHQTLNNQITLMISGKAVTVTEGARLRKELGIAINQGPEVFWKAVREIRERINAADRAVNAGYAPIVQDAYRQRSQPQPSTGWGAATPK